MMGGARPFICALSPVPSMRHRKQHSHHVQDASAYRRCNELSNIITRQWRLSECQDVCPARLGRLLKGVRHRLELPSVAGIDELRPGITSTPHTTFILPFNNEFVRRPDLAKRHGAAKSAQHFAVVLQQGICKRPTLPAATDIPRTACCNRISILISRPAPPLHKHTHLTVALSTTLTVPASAT